MWTDRTPSELHECYPWYRPAQESTQLHQRAACGRRCRLRTFGVRISSKQGIGRRFWCNLLELKDGVIICHENDRRRNSNPPSLWPSEAIWQSSMVADKEQTSPSDIRYVIPHSVKNNRTRMVMSLFWPVFSECQSPGQINIAPEKDFQHSVIHSKPSSRSPPLV